MSFGQKLILFMLLGSQSCFAFLSINSWCLPYYAYNQCSQQFLRAAEQPFVYESNLARQILCFHQFDITDYLENPAWYSAMEQRDWVKGISLILAGLILVRYPPPFRNWGIALIYAGISCIGNEYYDLIIDYLIDKGLIGSESMIEDLKG